MCLVLPNRVVLLAAKLGGAVIMLGFLIYYKHSVIIRILSNRGFSKLARFEIAGTLSLLQIELDFVVPFSAVLLLGILFLLVTLRFRILRLARPL